MIRPILIVCIKDKLNSMERNKGMIKQRSFYTRVSLILLALMGCSNSMAEEVEWERQVEHAQWSPRDSAGELIYDNKMWLLGGWIPQRVNDVWSSANGTDWQQVTSGAAWPNRNLPCTLSYKGKMWIMSGFDGSKGLNDVWYSTDGATWTEAIHNAPWQRRVAATAVVFDGKMWIMGGFEWEGSWKHFNDVWYSEDGINWTEAVHNAPWQGRGMHSSVVFQDKIWVLGGGLYNDQDTHFNDVWYSEDGINWTQAVQTAEYPARYFHCSVVYYDKMWVIAGNDHHSGIGGNLNDVWYSENGTEWIQANASAPWIARHEPSCLVFKNKLWIMGGNTGILNDYLEDDVWTYTAGGRIRQTVPRP